MPVYSMTGFASASAGAINVADDTPAASATVTVEMRSVNGRFLDLSLKLATISGRWSRRCASWWART